MYDRIVIDLYVEHNVPVDNLICDPDQLGRFVRDYNVRSGEAASAQEVSHRLLTLRKRGESNGGLPRLRRNYFGRGQGTPEDGRWAPQRGSPRR